MSRFTWSLTAPAVRAASAVDLAADKTETDVVLLFDQFRDPLLRYLASFGLAFADAEDVIQEVFLALFQHLRCGKDRDNLAGWLFRVAHNLALRQRFRTHRDLDAKDKGREDRALDPSPTPEDQLVNRQTQRRMQAVVEALTELDRRCLCLRAEGLCYREIAATLDISLGSVSISLARSLARIARVAER